MASQFVPSMKLQFLLVTAMFLMAALPAHAQTDTQGNTWVGTGALETEDEDQGEVGGLGSNNSAFGFNALNQNVSGGDNTATGWQALYANSTGNQNTAIGYLTLSQNNGSNNTALGWEALVASTSGNQNTAFGSSALAFNASGNSNVALGYGALYHSNGSNNTASGWQSLNANTTGTYNTAEGSSALFANTTGASNVATGAGALSANTTGNDNTGSGFDALYSNKVGGSNTASGYEALYANKAGSNSAFGRSALHANTTGTNNIALGYQAGANLTIGSNNIDIGNSGVAGEANTIRIGGSAQTLTYIGGITGTKVTGAEVFVTATGQLGTKASAERYKTAIAPMAGTSEKLQQLRPVTFHLKADPHGALQYGLIAEEVAKVYPDLVIHTASGRIDGVRYDELAPILLKEVQQQRAQTAEKIASQDAAIRELKHQVAELQALNQETQAALGKLQAADALLAQR